MSLFRTKYIIYLVSYTLIISAGIGLLLLHVFPEYYPQWYVPMALFFFLTELVTIYATNNGMKKLNQRKLVNLYLLIGVAKLLLSLLFVVAYALVVKHEKRSFGLIFMLFYFLYTLFDIFFYSKVEQQLKMINTIDR